MNITNGFIYNGFRVNVTPNGNYFTAIGIHSNGKFFGCFDKKEQSVINKIMTKIDNYTIS